MNCNRIKVSIFLLIILNSTVAYTKDMYYKTQNTDDTVIRTFLVTEIIKTKQAYYIQVQDSNSICYTIVSLKVKIKGNKESLIKVGKQYQFIVRSYFPQDMIPRPELSLEVKIDGIRLYVPMIGMNVLIAYNLQGLYYKSLKNNIGIYASIWRRFFIPRH